MLKGEKELAMEKKASQDRVLEHHGIHSHIYGLGLFLLGTGQSMVPEGWDMYTWVYVGDEARKVVLTTSDRDDFGYVK